MDLSPFMRWYEQAGTPTLSIKREATPAGMKLILRQSIPETAADTPTLPVPIPVPVRLIDKTGQDIPFRLSEAGVAASEHVLRLDSEIAGFELFPVDGDVKELQEAVPSWLRGFSAPVRLQDDLTVDDRLHLSAFDSDLFNRWDAMQQLLTQAVLARLNAGADNVLEDKIASAFDRLLADEGLDKAFQALMMRLPSQAVLEAAQTPADPPEVFKQKHALQVALAHKIAPRLTTSLAKLGGLETGGPEARALQNAVLDWGVAADLPTFVDIALAQSSSENMTLSEGALRALNTTQHPQRDKALAQFEAKWQDQSLVMEKYFSLQASAPFAATPEAVAELMTHPQFDATNPNKLRTTIGVFASMNVMQFHHDSGAGYRFIAQQLADIDKRNPQIAARMASSLARFGAYGETRQNQMRAALNALADGDISRDLAEVVGKALDK